LQQKRSDNTIKKKVVKSSTEAENSQNNSFRGKSD
jgi:hypothetical protein